MFHQSDSPVVLSKGVVRESTRSRDSTLKDAESESDS